MTIANLNYEFLGGRVYTPEGPYGAANNFFQPNWKPGSVGGGDMGAEFIFLYYNVVTPGQVVNQGDGFFWDNSGTVQPLSTAASPRGGSVVHLFLGGRFGDPAALQGNIWSYTFPTVGVYGCWFQRSGIGLVNAASTAATGNLANTTTTAFRVDAPVTPLVTSKLIVGLYFPPTSYTFTANTVSGSAAMSAVSTVQGLVAGMTLSGPGAPSGVYIKDIQGPVITMSVPATAPGTGVSITASNYAFNANTTNLSAVLTGITNLPAVYPNQAIAGTGVPALTTIVSIGGVSGAYTITMSAPATATNTAIAMTTNGYLEALISWPNVDKTN